MSIAVLMSILPWWCLKIADGEKTVEIRKNKPELPTPFKSYIYVPKKRPYLVWGDVFRGNWETEFTALSGYGWEEANRIWDVFNGKIMGEFICDGIDWHCGSELIVKEDREKALAGSCLNREELFAYLGIEPGTSVFDKRAEFYGWHISALKIYDKPKKLTNFIRSSGGCCNEGKCTGCEFLDKGNGYNVEDDCFADFDTDMYSIVTRPPQSWMYVEERS